MYILFFNEQFAKYAKKKNPKKTLNFKVSVNNDIPSVWFLENSWGKIILRRFGHKGQTLKRKTTFQISGCPTGLIQFYFLVYVVSGDGRKGSGLIFKRMEYK